MVVIILQLSYLTHAEFIHDVWDKADALGPLGERLSCCGCGMQHPGTLAPWQIGSVVRTYLPSEP